jgi:hypothetical protein
MALLALRDHSRPSLLHKQFPDLLTTSNVTLQRMQTAGDSTSDGSAAAAAGQRQRARLPVNPRRVKVAPEERKRVVRA